MDDAALGLMPSRCARPGTRPQPMTRIVAKNRAGMPTTAATAEPRRSSLKIALRRAAFLPTRESYLGGTYAPCTPEFGGVPHARASRRTIWRLDIITRTGPGFGGESGVFRAVSGAAADT